MSTAPETFTSVAEVRPIGCWANMIGAKKRTRKNRVVTVFSKGEEIPDQVLAVYGEHALRVKLHSFDGIAAMAQTHDGPVAVAALYSGGDFQFVRQAFVGNDQRVVAGTGHGAGQA